MTLLAFLSPATDRAILIGVVGGCYLGYHLYHLWRWWRAKSRRTREEEKAKVAIEAEGRNSRNGASGLRQVQRTNLPTGSEVAAGRGVPSAPQPKDDGNGVVAENAGGPEVHHHPAAWQEEVIRHSPSPFTLPPPSDALSGEELYAQARTMPHQPIPDCRHDAEYLMLLAKSAEKGYPRALAKLGDYAMRRGWLVEAYYWLWRAKRAGMGNLERPLLQVRSAWANGDFRRESANEYACFTHVQGTIGYALLCIDARHNVDAAKARLAECAPDFLD